MNDDTEPASQRDHAIRNLLATIIQAGCVMTSMQLSEKTQLPHVRVMNLIGHLKRQRLIDAKLIRSSASHVVSFYLVRSLKRPPGEGAAPRGTTDRAG
jgi:hypothetical protein